MLILDTKFKGGKERSLAASLSVLILEDKYEKNVDWIFDACANRRAVRAGNRRRRSLA